MKRKSECEFCLYSCYNECSIRRDIVAVHEGKKPITNVKFVMRAFATKFSMKFHIKIHERKKPCTCNICEHSDFEKSYMKIHIASVHEEKKKRVYVYTADTINAA